MVQAFLKSPDAKRADLVPLQTKLSALVEAGGRGEPSLSKKDVGGQDAGLCFLATFVNALHAPCWGRPGAAADAAERPG